MQLDEAKRLREQTPESIRKNCSHKFVKEYYLGTHTGDYVCEKCGIEK